MSIYQAEARSTKNVTRYQLKEQENSTRSYVTFRKGHIRDTGAQFQGRVIHIQPSSTDTTTKLREIFQRLVTEWSEDTLNVSSITDMMTHPAYLRIIGLGNRAIPLLLRELENNPNYWFFALNAITQQDPVELENRGNFERMRTEWLQWGRNRRLI